MVTNKRADLRRPMCIAEIWLKSFNRRVYDRIVSAPGRTHYPYRPFESNTYNMWQGWRYKYNKDFVVDKELIDVIVKHLKEIICDGNDDLCNYILKYFKLILLGHQLGVCLVVVGAQGTGKSLKFEYFGRRILGSDYFHLFQTLEQITSRFSSCRCYKSCLVAITRRRSH